MALKGFGHPIGNDTAMFPLLGESLNHHGVFSGKDFVSVLTTSNHMTLKTVAVILRGSSWGLWPGDT